MGTGTEIEILNKDSEDDKKCITPTSDGNSPPPPSNFYKIIYILGGLALMLYYSGDFNLYVFYPDFTQRCTLVIPNV